MSRPSCSAGGESWKRSASWAGDTAGNTKKRSTEKVSASRNRGSSFLVRTMITASWIPGLVINNCRESSKPRRLTSSSNCFPSSERTQRQRSRTRLAIKRRIPPISHLRGLGQLGMLFARWYPPVALSHILRLCILCRCARLPASGLLRPALHWPVPMLAR